MLLSAWTGLPPIDQPIQKYDKARALKLTFQLLTFNGIDANGHRNSTEIRSNPQTDSSGRNVSGQNL